MYPKSSYAVEVGLFDDGLLATLDSARSVLIAGAGGGFDVYSGLPLTFALEGRGKQVHLANLTFSDLRWATERPVHDAVVEVTADSAGSESYFPEKFLCRWFRDQGQQRSVFALQKTGVRPLKEAYAKLTRMLEVDAVVLVDGGTDILMRGDEAGLGTPAEDISSLVSIASLDVPIKVLSCLGFGVDAYHGVCHAHFLENVAELTREGAYLGALALLPHMPEVRRFLEAVEHVHAAAPERPSIVCASIASAIEGYYGDVHRIERTRGSQLWINPLMAQYFNFQLEPVAQRVLYRDAIENTETIFDISAVLERFRHERTAKPRQTIPV
jgi:hypothetical protein